MTSPPSVPPADDPTRRLVERIQAGDDKDGTFGQLYHLHHRRVFRFFIRLGFDASESEELTQDTFFRVYKNIESFEHGSRFERWLFVVAGNVYRNEIRRRKASKRGLPEVSLDDDESTTALSGAVVARDLSPLDKALFQEQRETLRVAVDNLPKQMRQCILFRIDQMLKYREIAALLGISIETVKAHLHQAQERLRVTLCDLPPAASAAGEEGEPGPVVHPGEGDVDQPRASHE